ncbi:MAG TPA: CoA-binding protein [Planctomycetota bacterium]|nr:CoA-binding protein [Planctomycetota bacterium]
MDESSAAAPPLNPSPEAICDLLSRARTIAIVGLSNDRARASHGIAQYLARQGYEVIPVNPTIESWKEIPSRRSLRDVTEKVDIVDVFRRPDAIPEIVEDAIAIGAPVLWLQPGAENDAAAARAAAAGITVISGPCIFQEHMRCSVHARR